jgi:hypothetical protein
MKKIKTTDITTSAAMPVKQGTLDHLQSAYQEILASLYLGVNQSILGVVWGCRLTQSGSNWSITAGAVYYFGEIYLCDAAAGVLGVGETIRGNITTTNLTAANADPVEFSNGLTYSVHEIQKIVWSSGTSGLLFSSFDGSRIGTFTNIPYDAANMTANVGTWTIGSGADWKVSASVIGVNADVSFEINNYTNSNSAAVTLSLDLVWPSGFSGILKIKRNTKAIAFVDDTGGAKIAQVEGVVGTSKINITILSGIDNPTFTNFNAATAIGQLKGQITLELEPLY